MTFDKRFVDALYERIAHGDAEHRAWLRDEMDKFCEEWKAKAPDAGYDHDSDWPGRRT